MVKIKREDLTHSMLLEYLRYDEDTGVFTWIKNTHRFKNRIGTTAGSISKRDSHIELRFMGTLYRAHVLAWFYMYKVFPKLHIDHKNHNEQDNSRINLREVTQLENNKNQSKRSDNTTGVCGVWFNERNKYKKYIAEIMVHSKKIALGSFITLQEATVARKTAEVKYSFHTNHGINKPL